MPTLERIRVMISSRCNSPFPDGNGGSTTLSAIRGELKKEWEAVRLLDPSPLFEVWINEEEPAAEASRDLWDTCLDEVRRADIVLVLYNGDGGWVGTDGHIGICHAELMAALSAAPAKVFVVQMAPLADGASKERDERFRAYAGTQQFFGAPARDAAELKQRCREALRAAVGEMVRLGGREARKGNFHSGDALAWSRLDYPRRKQRMEATLRETLLSRAGSCDDGGCVFARIDGRQVLLCIHAIPAAFSVGAARELVGQPFLHDHRSVGAMGKKGVGPVHLVGCHRRVTESQSLKQLGFPDATVVAAPFGVYVADDVQKIQLIFLADCRDETMTRHALQRLFDWLAQTGEDALLSRRAEARKRIVQAIAKEAAAV